MSDVINFDGRTPLFKNKEDETLLNSTDSDKVYLYVIQVQISEKCEVTDFEDKVLEIIDEKANDISSERVNVESELNKAEGYEKEILKGKLARITRVEQTVQEYISYLRRIYVKQTDTELSKDFYYLVNPDTEKLPEIFLFIEYKDPITRMKYEIKQGYAVQPGTDIKIRFLPTMNSSNKDEIHYFFYATSSDLNETEMQKIHLQDCGKEIILSFNSTTDEEEIREQIIELWLNIIPSFINSEDSKKLTDTFLYMIDHIDFTENTYPATNGYIVDNGKVYHLDYWHSKKYLKSFIKNHFYYFLTTYDEISIHKNDYIKKTDCLEEGITDPVRVQTPDQEIELKEKMSPGFIFKDDNTIVATDMFLYVIKEFETDDGDSDGDGDEHDNKPKEVWRYFLKEGNAFYSKSDPREGRKYFDLEKNTKYYFFISGDYLPVLSDYNGDTSKINSDNKAAKRFLRQEYCIEIEFSTRKNQILQLERKAVILIPFYHPVPKKSVFFPKETKITFSIKDDTDTEIESVVIEQKHPLIPVCFPYPHEAKKYSFFIEIAADTYVHITDKELLSQSDLNNNLTADDGYLMTHTLFLPPEKITLKDSKWSIEDPADTFTEHPDEVIDVFKESFFDVLKIVLMPEFQYFKFTYRNDTNMTLADKVIPQFLMLEGNLSPVPATAQSDLWGSDILFLPWIEMGQGKSYVEHISGAGDLKLSFEVKKITAIGLPVEWENFKWEINKDYRVTFDGEPYRYEEIILNAKYTDNYKISPPPKDPSTVPFITSFHPEAPLFEPDQWNDGGTVQLRTNCYAYAANARTGHSHSMGQTPQPGNAAGKAQTKTDTSLYSLAAIRAELIDCIKADGIALQGSDPEPAIIEANDPPPPKDGYYIVALVMTSKWMEFNTVTKVLYVGDYHWYRQDRDMIWSHKPGTTQVVWIDNSGDKITDPKICDRRSSSTEYHPSVGTYTQICDYDVFCGYFYVNKKGARVIFDASLYP